VEYKNKLINEHISAPTWILALSTALITLYINPSVADPFNSPKLWALMVFGTWLLGHLIININHNRNSLPKPFVFILGTSSLFLFSMLFSALNTKISYTAFLGEQQRRLGFIFYFFMVTFMLCSAFFFSAQSVSKLYKTAIGLALVLSIYGTLQNLGKDFISWNNPYNSIILTLGNPNFASALLSIIALLVFSFTFACKKIYRVPLFLLVCYLIALIVFSDSKQGLIAFGIGMSLFIATRLFWYNKKIGVIFTLFAVASAFLIFLAMLQKGPLVQYIYKTSVSLRGYYWRAGIEMFKSNLIYGVGVDSYGDYFRLFRENQYPLTFGYQISSDNAHNVPIQLFATSGILTGFFYVLLVIVVFIIGLRIISKGDLKERNFGLGIFVAWIAFQAQSIISIDNVGLTIWGWVLAGALVGIYMNKEAQNIKISSKKGASKTKNILEVRQKLLSGAMLIVVIVFCSLLYQGEKILYQLTSYVKVDSEIQSPEFEKALIDFNSSKLVEPAYKFRVANLLFQIGRISESRIIVNTLVSKNPNSFDYLNGCAQLNYFESNWQESIKCREQLSRIDPWNAENFLNLAQLYEKLSDPNNAIKNYEQILILAKDSEFAVEAKNSVTRLKLK